MDLFDERILSVLSDGKPKFFAQLLGEVGFGRNTVKLHLKRLVAQSLVVKKKTLSNGRGRPKYTYYVSPIARRQVSAALSDPSITIVALPFSRLRHVCRFEKGGSCKETKKNCASNLPPNPKIRITTTLDQFRDKPARCPNNTFVMKAWTFRQVNPVPKKGKLREISPASVDRSTGTARKVYVISENRTVCDYIWLVS